MPSMNEDGCPPYVPLDETYDSPPPPYTVSRDSAPPPYEHNSFKSDDINAVVVSRGPPSKYAVVSFR
jgi:hypothetical protein